jgi:hypothetical protein
MAMDVNEHQRPSNITLRHKLKQRNSVKHLGKGTARLLLLFISVAKGLPILSRTHNLK